MHDPRRLIWVGPLTVVAASATVRALQALAVGWLDASPMLRNSEEPVIFTAVLVTVAVIVFAAIAVESADANRTFRRLALMCLVVSCLPDLAVGQLQLIRGEGWTLALVFIVMHIAAWAVTVEMLTRLTKAPAVPR